MNATSKASSNQVVNTRAMWTAGFIGCMGLFFFIFSIAFEKIDRPRDYLMVGATLLLFLSSVVGVILIRAGKVQVGTSIVLAANTVMVLVVTLSLRGLATSLGSYLFVTNLLLIFAGMPPNRIRFTTISNLAVVVIIAIVEFWNPEYRGISPSIIDLANYFSTALWLVFMVVMVFQAQSRSLSVEGRVGTGFMVMIYVSVLVSLMAVRTFRDYNAASDALALSSQHVQVTTQLQSSLWRTKEAQMAVIFSPESANLENEYLFSRSGLEKSLAAWVEMNQDQAESNDLVVNIQNDVQNFIMSANQSVEAARGGRVEEATRLEIESVNPLITSLSNKLENAVTQAEALRLQSSVELDTVVTAGMLRTMGVGLFSLLVGGLLSIVIGQSIINPITELVQMAQALGRGDRLKRAHLAPDEIGALAQSLNNTAGQLDQLYSNLEIQVADRTRALEVSAEVSRKLSTILDLNQLVRAVVDQLRQAFDFYHVHIYLYDETRESLVMAGGTGEAGREMLARGHRLTPGKGLVGRAAETNQMVLSVDTTKEPNWLPNPLLPDTRSEVAVPISTGNIVLGVLDVQQDSINGVSEEDARLIQSIADQVAIAIQNARAYARAQYQAEHEQLITDVTQKVQQATSIEEVLQVAVRELGRALNARRASVELRGNALAEAGPNEPVQL